MAVHRPWLVHCAVFLLALCWSATGTAGRRSFGGFQSLQMTGNVASLSAHSGAARQLVTPDFDNQPASNLPAQCFRIALQPESWGWKELIWGTVEATVFASTDKPSERHESYAAPPRGPELGPPQILDEDGSQLDADSWMDGLKWSSGAPGSAFCVALVRLSDCTPGKATNATVVCDGDTRTPCSFPVSWSQDSCICIGKLPSNSDPLADISTPKPPTLDKFASKTPDSEASPQEASLPVSESQRVAPANEALVLQVKASVRVPKLSMVLTAAGLLILASAEPLSRLSAMHILLGGMLGAGLAHVGVMLAIAAVPGAVVALPWVAALSAYRLGICEALAMLVAGYVYTVAMALALLYLYTQHFSYVQAVYFFVVFHAALAGALRAESSRGSTGGQTLTATAPVAAVLAQAQSQTWVAVWVPGRAAGLQRTVYFALLACGGALFAGTTNVWLHAAILRAHSSHDLPLWLALAVSAAPVFILVVLEIHVKLLSTVLRAALALPRLVSDEGADVVRYVRTKLGFYVPGEARGGGRRYHLRPVRRVFYTHVLEEQETGGKWGPERDLRLLKSALRRVGYWLAGVKAPVAVSDVHQPGRWPGQALPGGLNGDGSTLTGGHWSDPTWSPYIDGSPTHEPAVTGEENGEEACSRLQELPRGSAEPVRIDEHCTTGGRRVDRRDPDSEGASGSCKYSSPKDTDCHKLKRKGPTQQAMSEPATLFGRWNRGVRSARRWDDRGEGEGSGSGALSGGGTLSFEGTCQDDREYDENVSEESESGAILGNDEWDWLAAEDITPGEALAAQSCPVCLSLRKNLAFGCGHQTCHSCGTGLAKCPICRKQITVRVKLYH